MFNRRLISFLLRGLAILLPVLQPGFLATKAIASSQEWVKLSPVGTTLPAGRWASSTIYDPSDNSMIVFGGTTGPVANDTWKLTLGATPGWTQLFPSGTAPNGTYMHTAVYNPTDNSMIVFGGTSGSNVPWKLDLGTSPSWVQLSPAGITLPGGRYGHTAIYNPSDNSMIVFGGYNGVNTYNLLNDTWKLTLGASPGWIQISPTGTPPQARFSHSAIYNPSDNSMIVFGGSPTGGENGLLNDIWKLDLGASPSWAQLSPAGTPPTARDRHNAIYNSSDNSMIVFGGSTGTGGNGGTRETWKLTLGASPGWVQLSSSGTIPTVRGDLQPLTYNPTDNSMTVFGGYVSGVESNDTWKLSFQYDVSGYTKTSSNTGISGVTLTVVGSSATTTSDNSGYFALHLNSFGNYTLSSSKNGYAFTPSTLSFNSLSADQSNQNFTATTYSIDGTIIDYTGAAMSGVTVSLNGLVPFSTTTASNGTYSFPAAPPGMYTLVPSKSSYVFNPGSRVFSLSVNKTDQNYFGNLSENYQSTNYVFKQKWGSYGTANEQFKGPYGIAVDTENNIFVSDYINNRIQKFSGTGVFLLGWGSAGTGNGEFNGLYGIAVDTSNNVYVADCNNHRIQKFSSTGAFLTLWGNSGVGNGQFNNPFGIAVDTANNVYVSDMHNNRIQKFSSDGVFLTLWGSFGTGNGQFRNPSEMAVDTANNVYVSDIDNGRIQKFTSSGEFIVTWGGVGTGNGQFTGPHGIVADAASNIYVADYNNHRIQKFTSSGAFLWNSGSQFDYPSGIAVDISGNIYVSEVGSSYRVQKFNPAKVVGGLVVDGADLPMSGVTFQASGGIVSSMVSGSNGTFSFTLAAGQNFTITLSKGGYVFSPASRNYNPLNADQNSQNFTATTYSVVGTVQDGSGNSLSGITLSIAGPVSFSATTSSGGGFTFSAVPTGSVTLTPSFQNWVFSPTSRTYTPLSANQTSQDFTAQSFSISGTLTDNTGGVTSGATISLKGTTYLSSSALLRSATVSNGTFSFTQIPIGTYTLFPSKVNYVFTPGLRGFSLSADLMDQNFVSSPTYLFQSTNYLFGQKWGTLGSGDGQFTSSEVAIDINGNVYLADYGNHRIQKFTNAGTFLAKWGDRGSAEGQFESPWGVAVDTNSNVYVADKSNHRIQKFTNAGTFLAKWGSQGNGDGQFSNPYGVAVDLMGNVYVADTDNHRIQKFNSSGTFLAKWGSHGTGDGQFTEPLGVVVDGYGDVYVADYGNRRIQKFTNAGTFLAKWGSQGSGEGQFGEPSGVAVDASGYVYVADYLNRRIQKFTNTGTFVSKWGNLGSGEGQFNDPMGVSVDTSGNVFVADRSNNRIQTFNPALVVSGTIVDGASQPMMDVTLNVMGGLTESSVTVTGGAFAFTLVAGLNFVVTPSKGGYTFSPENRNYNPLTVDQLNQNFTAATKTISGRIITVQGQLLYGVVLTITAPGYVQTTTSLPDGEFSFASVPSANVTLTPYKTSYLFSPSKKTYLPLSNNQADQDFTAYLQEGGSTPDPTALPRAIIDLAVIRVTVDGQVTLIWTAPGMVGASGGNATSYVVKYASTPITTQSQFVTATTVINTLGPAVAGIRQTLAISGLPNGVVYFAIEATNADGDLGKLSNVPSVVIANPNNNQEIVVTGSSDPQTRIRLPTSTTLTTVVIFITMKEDLSDAIKTLLQTATAKMKDNVVGDTVREFTMQDSGGTAIKGFDQYVTLEMPYTDANNDGIVDGTTINADDLKIMRLNEVSNEWFSVSDGGFNKVDKINKLVTAQVKHFSLYTIGRAVATVLDNVAVYPNPINFQTAVRNSVKFERLTAGASIKIFDLHGQLVKDLPTGSATNDGTSGHAEWDGKNDQGEQIASGLYFYVVTSATGSKKSGKIAVTK